MESAYSGLKPCWAATALELDPARFCCQPRCAGRACKPGAMLLA